MWNAWIQLERNAIVPLHKDAGGGGLFVAWRKVYGARIHLHELTVP